MSNINMSESRLFVRPDTASFAEAEGTAVAASIQMASRGGDGDRYTRPACAVLGQECRLARGMTAVDDRFAASAMVQIRSYPPAFATLAIDQRTRSICSIRL